MILAAKEYGEIFVEAEGSVELECKLLVIELGDQLEVVAPLALTPDDVDMSGVLGHDGHNHHGVNVTAPGQLPALGVQHAPAEGAVDNQAVVQHDQADDALVEGVGSHFVLIRQTVQDDYLAVVSEGCQVLVRWTANEVL